MTTTDFKHTPEAESVRDSDSAFLRRTKKGVEIGQKFESDTKLSIYILKRKSYFPSAQDVAVRRAHAACRPMQARTHCLPLDTRSRVLALAGGHAHRKMILIFYTNYNTIVQEIKSSHHQITVDTTIYT